MTDTTTAHAAAPPQEAFALTTSRGFPDWLQRMGASISFTTYQAGKIFFLGIKEPGRIAVFERTFARCMGLARSEDARKLALATHYQIYRFDNVLPPGQMSGVHDAVYTPRVSWITGDVDAHDIAFDADGNIVFVNTLFSCLATISEGYSFKPIWQPPFITKLAPEDRCHMNGLAMESGRPRYVTMVSKSDVADGWRDRRSDGGMIMDVTNNERVVEGLSMPHSPRVHEGKLWVLNSGNITLGMTFGKVVVGPDAWDVGELLRETGNPVFDPDRPKTAAAAVEEGFRLAAEGKRGPANRELALSEWGAGQCAALYLELYRRVLAEGF